MSIRIKKIIGGNTTCFDDRFIPDYNELTEVINQLKKSGYKIVLTQGVYDMVHQGHAIYLERARAYGDILVVGVDSDALTKSRKGPSRPIVPESERLQMLVHLRHVDIVTLRDIDHDIGFLIKTVQPDVLIVSESTGDFSKKDVQSYKKFCKEIVMLPPQATTSTSARIRHVSIGGATELAQEIMKNIPTLVEKALAKINQK